MFEMENTMIGRGRDAIDMIVDENSFDENKIGAYEFEVDYGPGSVVGTAVLEGETVTIIANDAMAFNDRFPVVFGGVIGLEEGYKMATAVYKTIETDKDKPLAEKRPIVLIVDTPGNGPGKMEEIAGMNKATGAYQLALAEARKTGHPIIAMVIGRAISGAFLCHGLQADEILALSKDFGTMIHVMPITSVARITKMDIERLEELSKVNPVFAPGVDFFYNLGGVKEVVNNTEDMRSVISKRIKEVQELKAAGEIEKLGPWGRGLDGCERGGRTHRMETIKKMNEEFDAISDKYINA
ncbi:biotin-independent malonate decarboxylase subunit gamma [uncultured Veillonella sp.]|uniref:biotin-independent malonate decarboxylase subunit gamma n=1 Tax=uncultured Veillonella sp. TaxID=159268 RepID=UPI0025D5623B|nr:biotin-independent malonate decarboxylase subunit gamma [uncultured Veillonella sp.]MDY3973199.1 biotin-independent malonate decarboxylase subunit gamma [Veillonella caviae]